MELDVGAVSDLTGHCRRHPDVTSRTTPVPIIVEPIELPDQQQPLR